MRLRDFHYDLPEELIAQEPLALRRDSRLLCLDGDNGQRRDCVFRDLGRCLKAGDLLVFNDTKVIPARVFGRKRSGGRIEVLIERILGDQRLLAMVRASKTPKIGSYLLLGADTEFEVVGRQGIFFELRMHGGEPLSEFLVRVGEVPLPPYIKRSAKPVDHDRYQTVYARVPGAVAAPTAGLHFDAAMLDKLTGRGIASVFVTLHVGAGTFQPVRCENIEDHQMHAEQVHVPAEACAAINRTRAAGGRIVAVGTTSLRALESAVGDDGVEPICAETELFVYPGYRFRCVDALITNFHLPASTLLILVCAFAGTEATFAAYRHAVAERYRFFSYGDAMFVTRSPR